MKYIYVRAINSHRVDTVRFESIFVDVATESDAYYRGQTHTFPALAADEYLVNDYVTPIPTCAKCKPRKNIPWPGDWVKWNGQVGQVMASSSINRISNVMVGSTVYSGVSVDDFDEIRSTHTARPEQV